MAVKSKPKRPAVQLKDPVLLGRATIGDNEWSLGASWLDDETGMVPWWFKNDKQGYTSHTSPTAVLSALRAWGYKGRIVKDKYPLIEVEKKDADGHQIAELDEYEKKQTLELIEKGNRRTQLAERNRQIREGRFEVPKWPKTPDEYDVPVRRYAQRRYVKDRFGDSVYVGRWPSDKGFGRLRRHYKRMHPRAFRASVRKGVATRKRNARQN